MTPPNQATYKYVAFFDLLADAIFQHKMAMNETNQYLSNRYVRASISASALSVECFANCLLAISDSPKKTLEDLDKLPPISKVEVALRFQKLTDLNRGRVEVQRIAELIKARNEFVHPKVTTLKVSIGIPQDTDTEWVIPISMDQEHWGQLGIPKMAMFWSVENSLSVLSAISSFYRHVLVDVMNANAELVNAIFISRLEIEHVRMPGVNDEFREQITAAAELGIDFSFLGLTKSANG